SRRIDGARIRRSFASTGRRGIDCDRAGFLRCRSRGARRRSLPMPAGRPIRRLLLALSVSTVVALLAVEILLRLAGVTPQAPLASIAGEPVVHQPDERLGWHTRPGRYVLPPYVPGGASAELTILADGSRATAPQQSESETVLLLIGCSFTFGWAI